MGSNNQKVRMNETDISVDRRGMMKDGITVNTQIVTAVRGLSRNYPKKIQNPAGRADEPAEIPPFEDSRLIRPIRYS